MAQARLVSSAPARARCSSHRSMRSSPGCGRASRCVCLRPATDRRRGTAVCRRSFRAMSSMPSSAIRSRASCARSGPAASGISTALRSPRWRWSASCCPAPRSTSCTRSSRAPAIREAFAVYGVTDFAFDSARRAGEDIAGDGAGWARRRPAGAGAVRAARFAARAAPSTTCPANSARRSTRRSSCCAPRGRTPPASASPFMSARNASNPMPMLGRWRWPARRSRVAAFRSTSSMSAAASRSAIPI